MTTDGRAEGLLFRLRRAAAALEVDFGKPRDPMHMISVVGVERETVAALAALVGVEMREYPISSSETRHAMDFDVDGVWVSVHGTRPVETEADADAREARQLLGIEAPSRENAR